MAETTFNVHVTGTSSSSSFEQLNISATDLESTDSFSQEVLSAILLNDGDDSVHVNFDALATVSHFKLTPKSWLSLDLNLTDVHTICAAGETATVYAIGIY